MSYRPVLEIAVLQQIRGLPSEAFGMLVDLIGDICGDPYDRLLSKPLTADGRERQAEMGDFGWIEFIIDEDAGLIRVYCLVWTG